MMSVLFLATTLFIIQLTSAFQGCSKDQDPVKLTVFYESYCPYSRIFIVTQLYPAWRDIRDSVSLELVPSGFEKLTYENGHFRFECQHGVEECVANMLHACAIYTACGSTDTRLCPDSHLDAVLGYINCLMQEDDQEEASQKCAEEAGLNSDAINQCAVGEMGQRLASKLANVTHAFNSPPVSILPYIVINNKYSGEERSEALENLRSTVYKYSQKTVNMTLFYESYCPYSRTFVVNQLWSSWQRIGHYVRLNLVPSGFARQHYEEGHRVFTCQHGVEECIGNTLHACAIYQACGDRGTQGCPLSHTTQALHYISCLMKKDDQEEASQKCAAEAGLKSELINACATGGLGERLASHYVNVTRGSTNPEVTELPLMVFNDKYNSSTTDEAQEDLERVIYHYTQNPIKLTVFYESYCPYSRVFVTTQLHTAWSKIKKYVELELVPAGFATQTYINGHYKFECQHGAEECIGNILHACAIYEACGIHGTLHCPPTQLTKVLDYISCLMTEEEQEEASNECAATVGFNTDLLKGCVTSELGETLASHFLNVTKAFHPKVDILPYVVFNDKYNGKTRGSALSNLTNVVFNTVQNMCQ